MLGDFDFATITVGGARAFADGHDEVASRFPVRRRQNLPLTLAGLVRVLIPFGQPGSDA